MGWKDGTILTDRLEKFESIGFVNYWIAKPPKRSRRRDDAKFKENCALVAERRAKGDFNMPQKNDQIGKRVADQRKIRERASCRKTKLKCSTRLGFVGPWRRCIEPRPSGVG